MKTRIASIGLLTTMMLLSGNAVSAPESTKKSDEVSIEDVEFQEAEFTPLDENYSANYPAINEESTTESAALVNDNLTQLRKAPPIEANEELEPSEENSIIETPDERPIVDTPEAIEVIPGEVVDDPAPVAEELNTELNKPLTNQVKTKATLNYTPKWNSSKVTGRFFEGDFQLSVNTTDKASVGKMTSAKLILYRMDSSVTQVTSIYKEVVIGAAPITVAFKNIAYDPSIETSYLVEVVPTPTSLVSFNASVTRSAKALFKVQKYTTQVTDSNFTGQSINVLRSKSYRFKATVSNQSLTDRNVYVQKYNQKTKKWDNVLSNKTGTKNLFTFSFLAKPSLDAVEEYRLHTPATANQSVYTSKITKIKRTLDNFKVISSVPTKAKLAPWTTTDLHFYVDTNSAKKWVTLQRKIGDEPWKNIGKTLSKTVPGTYTFKTSKGTTNSRTIKIQYRVYLYADTYNNSATSKAQTASWDNPYRYTGMKKEMWNYTKKQCPTTLVETDSKLAAKGAWGLAKTSTNISVFYSKVTSKHRRTVANHECAHHLQYASYKKSKNNYASFLSYLDKAYGTSKGKGLEKSADCMANIMNKNSYWAYGASSCSGTRDTIARAMLKGQALKY